MPRHDRVTPRSRRYRRLVADLSCGTGLLAAGLRDRRRDGQRAHPPRRQHRHAPRLDPAGPDAPDRWFHGPDRPVLVHEPRSHQPTPDLRRRYPQRRRDRPRLRRRRMQAVHAGSDLPGPRRLRLWRLLRQHLSKIAMPGPTGLPARGPVPGRHMHEGWPLRGISGRRRRPLQGRRPLHQRGGVQGRQVLRERADGL